MNVILRALRARRIYAFRALPRLEAKSLRPTANSWPLMTGYRLLHT